MKRKKLCLSPELNVPSKFIHSKLIGGKEIEYMNRNFPNLHRYNNSLSLYASKDKTEKIFTQKVKTVIETDPSLKNITYKDITKQNYDQFKPEGYIYFDFLLKHPLLLEKMKKLPKISKNKIKQSSTEENKTKDNINNHSRLSSFPLTNDSDLIIHQNNHIIQETSPKLDLIINNNNNKSRNVLNEIYKKEEPLKKDTIFDLKKYPSQRYVSSDILNLTEEKTILNRSGENHLFKPSLNNKKLSYSTSTESKIGWIPKMIKQPTLLNHASVKYNIITPTYKSQTFTKPEVKQILNEHYYKTGSLSQFIDLTRVSSPNLNNIYIDTLFKNKTPFNQHNNIGANYLDMHHTYKGLFKNFF